MITIKAKDSIFEDIAAILWDKDGTLADSHGFLQELAKARSRYLNQHSPGIEQALMRAFGCAEAYDPTGLMAVGTRYDNEIAAAAYIAATGKPWAEALDLAQQGFAESDRSFTRKADFTPPFSGIVELLSNLWDSGLKLAVLSGDTTANIQDFLLRYDLVNYVTWCAGSEAPPVKPNPQMVWTACENLGISPENSLVVGDSKLDGQLAEASGAGGFISVTWGGSPAIAGADAVLDHPEQLTVYLNHGVLK
ncbi:HAD family hydrolase [Oscillatoria sp. CS-180]|uniref:HAD family hydrolase n=1 Tax=Oscillatoria sp. CS-180 TaxID=3021720 RepID=UPI00232E5B1D|nr:HAD family hydrolase [Oscillatoria sp. CS-180]MDB9528912.1 HAD family hydrolase [Oscillatoria sp. CS-180]